MLLNVGIGTTNPGSYRLKVEGGKFSAPSNVYDSGWFNIAANTTYTKTHDLGTDKFLAIVWAKDSAGNVSVPRGGIGGWDSAGDIPRGLVLCTPTTTQVSIRTLYLDSTVMRTAGGAGTATSARVIMLALE